MTARPRAWSMPADTAAWWPKFRLRWMAATFRSACCNSRMSSGRGVPAAVVDQQNLVGNAQRRKRLGKPVVKLADGLLLIEERNHDAENRRVSQDWPGGGLALFRHAMSHHPELLHAAKKPEPRLVELRIMPRRRKGQALKARLARSRGEGAPTSLSPGAPARGFAVRLRKRMIPECLVVRSSKSQEGGRLPEPAPSDRSDPEPTASKLADPPGR